MTQQQIQAKADRDAILYAAAREIRKILDEARTSCDAIDWDESDLEARILKLVTE